MLFRSEAAQRFGERGIEERRVLVGVNHFDITLANGLRHPPTDAPVAPRPAIKTNQIDPFGDQLFTDPADRIEAEDGGCDSSFEPTNGFAYEHFRARNLHQVNYEGDTNRIFHDDTEMGRCEAGYGYGSVSGGNPDGDGFSRLVTARVMAWS